MSARIVVAVEGSALAHAMVAMPSGGCIVTIQPSNRFSSAFKSVAEFAGILFAYIVAEASGQQLRLSTERLLRLLEVVDKRIGGACG